MSDRRAPREMSELRRSVLAITSDLSADAPDGCASAAQVAAWGWTDSGTETDAVPRRVLRRVRASLGWLCRNGYVVIGGTTPGGDPRFRLTDEGRAALPPRTGGVGHDA